MGRYRPVLGTSDLNFDDPVYEAGPGRVRDIDPPTLQQETRSPCDREGDACEGEHLEELGHGPVGP